MITETGHMLVDRIVYYFRNQVIQTLCPNAPDVHTGSHPDRFQPLKHLDIFCAIIVSCHKTLMPPFRIHGPLRLLTSKTYI